MAEFAVLDICYKTGSRFDCNEGEPELISKDKRRV